MPPLQPILIYTYAGDRAPDITFTIKRKQPGTATPVVVDLTSAQEVDFIIYDPTSGDQTNVDAATCAFLEPSAGQVVYSWNSGDLPYAGTYKALLRIMWPTNRPETVGVTIVVQKP